MSKVYVVYEQHEDYSDIVGVFSNKEKADEAEARVVQKVNAANVACGEKPDYETNYLMQEFELDISNDHRITAGFQVMIDFRGDVKSCDLYKLEGDLIRPSMFGYNSILSMSYQITLHLPNYVGYGETTDKAKEDALGYKRLYESKMGYWKIYIRASVPHRESFHILYNGTYDDAFEYMKDLGNYVTDCDVEIHGPDSIENAAELVLKENIYTREHFDSISEKSFVEFLTEQDPVEPDVWASKLGSGIGFPAISGAYILPSGTVGGWMVGPYTYYF